MCGQQVKFRVDIDVFKVGAKPSCGLGAKVTAHGWREATAQQPGGIAKPSARGHVPHLHEGQSYSLKKGSSHWHGDGDKSRDCGDKVTAMSERHDTPGELSNHRGLLQS